MFFTIAVTIAKVVLYVFVLPLFAWFVYIRTSKFHTVVNRLPGPRFYLPVLGFFPKIKGGLSEILRTAQVEWPRLYGEIYRLFAGNNCFVIITSPELIETICKSQKYIEKGASYDLLLPWLGRGLLTNFGDSWKARRRLLTPAFHFEILNNFIEIYNEQSRTLMRILRERSEKNERSEPVDMGPLAHRCTLEIMCEAAMGVKVNAQTTDSEFFQSIECIGQIIHTRIRNPWLMIPFVFNYISPLGKELKAVISSLNSFSDKVIEERRQNRTVHDENAIDASQRKRLALLDLLLKVSDGEQELTSEEVRFEINTFLLAGHDTTATLVCWFLYLMASYPEHQEKVREELNELFGDSDRYCTQDDLSSMKYLECCIKETLRMYPSAPVIARSVPEDIKLGDYVIPEGSSLLLSIYGLHKNPKHFPDPDKFDPERFYPEAWHQRHPFSYIPFSAGPRNCIGQRFAMMEVKVILSTLLRNLEFKLSADCEAPKPFIQIVLKSLSGCKLLVSPVVAKAL